VLGLRPLAVLLVAAGLVGCAEESSAGQDASSPDDEARPLRARVVVERTEGLGPTRTNVSAKFFHASAEELVSADQLVGFDLQRPPIGACAPLLETSTLDVPDVSIDLLDVGDVSLRVPGSTTDAWLSARAFPDVGDLVSGVFYTSPDRELGLPAPGEYRITVGCIDDECSSRAVADVELGAAAPVGPSGVSAQLDPAGDLEVVWEVVADDADVFVDVLTERPLRCSVEDTGRLLLSAEAAALDAQSTVVVHHFARRATTSALVAVDGVVSFDLSRAVPVTR
jgi:hypothetical protein